MAKFDDKVNGDTVDATEYNNIVRSNKNAITDSDQTIVDLDNTQLSKAIANYSAISTFYTDSGTANNYILNVIGSFKSPTALKDGLEVRFRPGNNSSTASQVTLPGIAATPIKLEDGVTDISGEITNASDVTLRYSQADSAFLLKQTAVTNATTTTTGTSILPDQITISNNVTDSEHDIDFAAGNFIFSDGSGQAAASALTKRIDSTWVAGNNVGGLASGVTLDPDETYYCFALSNTTGLVTDFGFDTSVTATNLLVDANVIAAGLTKFKRVASLLTDGSSNIRNGTYTFYNDGSYYFSYKGGNIIDLNTTTPSTARTPAPVTTPPNVLADLNILYVDNDVTVSFVIIFKSENDTDIVPTINNCTVSANSNVRAIIQSFFKTDSLSQVFYRSSDNAAAGFQIKTTGWLDNNL